MPRVMKCNICGAPVGRQLHIWQNEIRAIYVNGHEWSFPALSGLGIHHDEIPRLPPMSDQRYEDSNHDPALEIEILSPQEMLETIRVP